MPVCTGWCNGGCSSFCSGNMKIRINADFANTDKCNLLKIMDVNNFEVAELVHMRRHRQERCCTEARSGSYMFDYFFLGE